MYYIKKRKVLQKKNKKVGSRLRRSLRLEVVFLNLIFKTKVINFSFYSNEILSCVDPIILITNN